MLVSHGAADVFNHPVVEKLLKVKWRRFGLKMYLVMQMWYTIILILFTIGFAGHQVCECMSVSVSVSVSECVCV